MKLKSDVFPGMRYLEIFSKGVSFVFALALILAAGMEVITVFENLIDQNIFLAIQEGLFILILLEMFYVVRSFIKYGSINVGLVVNVGLVAAIKELIFVMKDLTLNLGIAFSLIFISLAAVYLVESRHYLEKKKVIKVS